MGMGGAVQRVAVHAKVCIHATTGTTCRLQSKKEPMIAIHSFHHYDKTKKTPTGTNRPLGGAYS